MDVLETTEEVAAVREYTEHLRAAARSLIAAADAFERLALTDKTEP